jgi:hypothetical protein
MPRIIALVLFCVLLVTLSFVPVVKSDESTFRTCFFRMTWTAHTPQHLASLQAQTVRLEVFSTSRREFRVVITTHGAQHNRIGRTKIMFNGVDPKGAQKMAPAVAMAERTPTGMRYIIDPADPWVIRGIWNWQSMWINIPGQEDIAGLSLVGSARGMRDLFSCTEKQLRIYRAITKGGGLDA